MRSASITARADYSWPAGRRLAVYVALNIEAFGFGVGKGVAIAPPDQAQSHSIYSERDYGNRVGVWRLFDLLDELGMPAEAQVNTALYELAPDIPARLRARGDEILGHGVTNSEEQEKLSEDAERADRAGGGHDHPSRGRSARQVWMSPWLSNSAVTMDLLQEAGYRYVMDWTMDDQPIWLRTRKGRILALPYPIEVNDTRGIVWYHYTSAEFVDMIVDQFDEMLEQAARQPLVCPISLHPFVMGRPCRIRQLRRTLKHILEQRDRVWVTRPRDICAHIESLPAGIVPRKPVALRPGVRGDDRLERARAGASRWGSGDRPAGGRWHREAGSRWAAVAPSSVTAPPARPARGRRRARSTSQASSRSPRSCRRHAILATNCRRLSYRLR